MELSKQANAKHPDRVVVMNQIMNKDSALSPKFPK